MNSTNNILFIPHGGGPLPLLGEPSHTELVNALKEVAAFIGKPRAIIVISAHWECSVPTITSSPLPELIYDYGGFPEESYRIQYACPGETNLALHITQTLIAGGIEAKLDEHRGLDHGVFVPLKVMYPDADIPCIQLSLLDTLDPTKHLAIGEALRKANLDNILILGSGASFHNLRQLMGSEKEHEYAHEDKNTAFHQWLGNTMSDTSISEQERSDRLVQWKNAPHAKFCHPREEHLMPLHVCYGMAGKACNDVRSIQVMHKQHMMFRW